MFRYRNNAHLKKQNKIIYLLLDIFTYKMRYLAEPKLG
jgi:hypothetical protein